MLINSKELLKKAKKNKTTIFQFNINNLEFAKYIIEKADELNKPIILGVSEGAVKYMGGYNTVFKCIEGLLQDLNPKIDIVLHLDHGKSVESCEKAIKTGFTSVMYDGSNLSIEENIKNTKYLVDKYPDISIEGELGAIGTSSKVISYTTVEDAINFSKETNIDSLAVAVGNVHGIYKGKPNINIDLIKEISEKTQKPLVLHGGSGIDKETFQKAIKNGISKININTQIQIIWYKEVRKFIIKNKKVYDPRKVISSGEKKVKELIEYYLNIA